MLFKLIFLGYEVSITNYVHHPPTINSSTECERHKLIDQNVDEEANVALIHQGLLGASPTQPTVAFTIEALEFYHQLRRCQGNISIQTIIKVLCAIHNVRSIFYILISGYILTIHLKITYTNLLRNQFASALDAYLDILRRVQTLVNDALGRGPGWRIRNACPPCGYKV